jgi:hypothetical protein
MWPLSSSRASGKRWTPERKGLPARRMQALATFALYMSFSPFQR